MTCYHDNMSSNCLMSKAHTIDLYLDSDSHFLIACHVSLVDVQTNYCNNNLLILDVKQLNKIMKLYYFYTLKALWDGQGKIKMYYEMPRVKKQLSGKRPITKIFICAEHTDTLNT